MKNKLQLLCTALFFCLLSVTVKAQYYLDVVFSTSSTIISATPGTNISIQMAVTGQPPHDCVGSSGCQFILEYQLIDIPSSTSYIAGVTNIFILGQSCPPTNQWTGQGSASFVIPCTIPTGQYRLLLNIKNLTKQDGSGVCFNSTFNAFDFVNSINNSCNYAGSCNMPALPSCSNLVNVMEIDVTNNTLPITVTSISTPATCGYSDGSASINTVSGGVSPYSYSWNTSPVQNTATAANLNPGTYICTITDASGCKYFETVTLGGQIVNYDYPNGINITSSTQTVSDLNSDGKIMIKGPVYINANYTLANQTWYFGNDYTLDQTGDLGIPPSGVMILPGYTLTMDNTIFTNVPNCDMWYGVQVLGKPATLPSKWTSNAKTISNIGITPAVIGKLIMKNASVIQHAQIGVSCYRSTIPFSKTIAEYGAGLLQATTNSKFIDNHIGVLFNAYSLLTNNSYINDCQFICSAPLPDARYNGEGTEVFINLNLIKGPNFRGNSFTNTYSGFSEDKRGTGIRSYNAGYNVVPSGAVGNTFNNLTNGINTFATGGLKNINVNGNTFDNVQQAITTAGTNYDNITGNTFNIPDKTIIDTWGVYLNGTSGFNISTGNNFNKCTGCSGTNSKGLIVQSGGTFGGNISKNNFNNLQIGTQSEGNNGSASGGMQLKCNTYTGNQYAISVSPQFPAVGSLAPQGIGCGPSDPRPANNFPDACTGGGVYKDINSTISFAYYENNNNTSPSNSSCVNPSVIYNQCTPITADDCSSVARCTNMNCLQTLQNKMQNEPNILEKKQLLQELIIGHLLSNTNNPEMVIKNILEAWNTLESRKLLVPIYIDEGAFVKARNTLNQIPQSTTDDIKYHQLYDVMITLGENGKTIHEMSLSQEMIVRDVANSSTLIKYHAQSVLEGANKEHYIRIPEEIQLSTARLANSNNENTVTALYDASKPLLLSNYPNPFNENTVIPYYLPNDAITGVLSITDITGRIIKTYNLDKGVNKIEFNTEELQNGIYYYSLIVDGKLINTKKMTLIK